MITLSKFKTNTLKHFNKKLFCVNKCEPFRVVVLGGTGTFGSIISSRLCKDPNIQLILVARDKEKLNKLQKTLQKLSAYPIETYSLDLSTTKLSTSIQELKDRCPLNLVIHTCGPFVDYKVAEYCLRYGWNYIDLADNASFVNNFSSKFHSKALEKEILMVSGASTVPALSSAVIDFFLPKFSTLESVETSISIGTKTPKGLSTALSVLSYAGVHFKTLQNSRMNNVIGWGYPGSKITTFAGIPNKRMVSYCNVPDLELFPKYYKSLKNLEFRAGIELIPLQMGITFLSFIYTILNKIGIVNSSSGSNSSTDKVKHFQSLFTNFIAKAFLPLLNSKILQNLFGTSDGGMKVTLTGFPKNDENNKNDNNKRRKIKINWYLCGSNGDGPHVPSTPPILIASKLAKMKNDRLSIPSSTTTTTALYGAFPCIGLFSLSEFVNNLKEQQIHTLYHEETEEDKDNFYMKPFAYGLGKEMIDKFNSNIINFHIYGGIVEGFMKVKRSSRFFQNILATLGGLPKGGGGGGRRGGNLNIEDNNLLSEFEKSISLQNMINDRNDSNSQKVGWAKVKVEVDNSNWRRTFSIDINNNEVKHQKLDSVWSIKNGLIVESFLGSCFSFGFQLRPIYSDDNNQKIIGFEHITKRMYIHLKSFMIPIPSFLALTANGKTIECDSISGSPGWYAVVEVKSPLFGFLLGYEGFVVIKSNK
eukprot:TRINITY_DN1228_c3_g1_i1.p1 TRINITY_DN1228_c3_g1~~TRINITY_DN1228_c3_g1_i1.p1  ORF type:complete len:702 (-),score=89.55 TRINITY_DN1228_c3_g1_i1:22-2127(-)